ncbi:transcription repressor OFP8 [Rosa sericea]
MSSSKKNKFLKTLVTSSIRGCGCGRPKLSDVFEPTPKPKIPICKTTPNHQPHSSSSSCDMRNGSFTVDDDDDDDDEDQCTSTTISFNNDSTLSSSQPSDSAETQGVKKSKPPSPPLTKINNSIAVVKDSDDPYQDFRQSMLQMIIEKEIYSKEELQELLSCFLELNSRRHHDVIIEAFTEIWNGDLVDIAGKRIVRVNPRCGTCEDHSHVRH